MSYLSDVKSAGQHMTRKYCGSIMTLALCGWVGGGNTANYNQTK